MSTVTVTNKPAPQFRALHFDIQPCYKVLFEGVEYKRSKGFWEVDIKLLDTNSGNLIGTKSIRWPHKNPPEKFYYDTETNVLVWENSQDVARMPLKVPDRRKDRSLEKGLFQPAKPNPEAYFYQSFDETMKAKKPKLGLCSELILKVTTANGFGASQQPKATASTTSDSPGESILKQNGTPRTGRRVQSTTSPLHNGGKLNGNSVVSRTQVADFILQLRDNMLFNPLFEARLTREQQVLGLKAFSHYWELNYVSEVLNGLVEKRFFDTWAINSFIVDRLNALGQTASNNAALLALLQSPQVLILDEAFITLAKICSDASEWQLRKILVQKAPETLEPGQLASINADEAVTLMESLAREYVIPVNVDEAVNLLHLLITYISSKFVLLADQKLCSRLCDIQKVIWQSFNIGKQCLRYKELRASRSDHPNAGSASDYRVRRLRVNVRKLVAPPAPTPQ